VAATAASRATCAAHLARVSKSLFGAGVTAGPLVPDVFKDDISIQRED
jgi:hypothetical protein